MLSLTFSGLSFAPRAFSQAAPPARTVRVVKGDTLEAIAAREGVSVQALMQLNKISKPEALQIGQELKLPPSKGVVQVRPATRRGAGSPSRHHGGGVAEGQPWRQPGPAPHRHLAAIAASAGKGEGPGQGGCFPQAKSAGPAQTKVAAPAQAKEAAASPAKAGAAAPPASAKPAAAAAAAPVTPPAISAAAAGPAPPPSPLPPGQGQPPQPGAEPTRWRFFRDTLVDWAGWKLHPGGVRVTLVQPTQADVGENLSGATAVAVHCSSLRQAWLVNGVWQPWGVPEARSVGQQIVLALCANVTDNGGQVIPPPPAP